MDIIKRCSEILNVRELETLHQNNGLTLFMKLVLLVKDVQSYELYCILKEYCSNPSTKISITKYEISKALLLAIITRYNSPPNPFIPKIVKILCKNGADTNILKSGMNPLHYVMISRTGRPFDNSEFIDMPIGIKECITSYGFLVNNILSTNINILCEYGVNVNAVKGCITPLQYAITHNYPIEVFKTLLKFGANVHVKNTYLKDMMKHIIKYSDNSPKSLKLISLLLEYDAQKPIEYPENNNIAILNKKN